MAPLRPTIAIGPRPIGPVRPGSLPTKIATSGTASAVARCGRGTGELRPLEAEIDRALGRVAERTARERAVAGDRVQGPADPVPHVIERGRQGFADTVAVVAVAAPMREPGHQGGAQQPL